MKLWALLLLAASLSAQDFSQRGFVELRFTGYPQSAPGDSGHAIGEALLRYEASYRLLPGLQVYGALDAETDTHRQVDREWDISIQDRSRRRPAIAVRRLSVRHSKGPVTVELGKQFIRWGKADVLNPTDRFAPRDFLGVVDNDFLAVTAARVTWEAAAGNSVDLVYEPRFTPSRVPLLENRWAVRPASLGELPIVETAPRFPGGPQFGARWNHVGTGFEHSVSFFEGFNHLPLIEGRLEPFPPRIATQRFYPRLRMYGADAAVPLRWFTAKGEAGWFTSTDRQADEYVQYVVQLERQTGEWSLVGGYAGEVVTKPGNSPNFAPDRGLARAFLGRASYTIDVNRSFAFEGAVRQSGDGVWLKIEYSQAAGQHLRATAGFVLIRGAGEDFLGQYRRNSHFSLALRYSL